MNGRLSSALLTTPTKIISVKELQLELIDNLKRRIKKANQCIKRITKPEVKHQKKRRFAIVEQKLESLCQDRKEGITRLCFGSKERFHRQFRLEDNGYPSYKQWRSDWQSVRKNQFFVLGSKDETAGCQGCVATVAEDGSISLRLRLPNALKKKYTIISGLRFEHGHEAIVASIGRNLSDDKKEWQAISYRFLKDDKGWRVFATVSLPEVKQISDLGSGVIGVDINENHLAVTQTDRFGNPIEFFSVPCATYGKTAQQRRAIIGRRSMGLSEALLGQLHVTLPLPARNRRRHVLSKWAAISRKTSAAHAAHRRSGPTTRSSPSPAFGQGTACDHSAWAGETPVCQSSLELFE